ICGMTSRNRIPVAFANVNVATVYIPNGKTRDQYWGSYVIGTRSTTCLQKPTMTNSGIHQVPVAQQNSVKPPINGWKSRRTSQLFKLTINCAPANVVIAKAPILIQYGAVSLAGSMRRKIQR